MRGVFISENLWLNLDNVAAVQRSPFGCTATLAGGGCVQVGEPGATDLWAALLAATEEEDIIQGRALGVALDGEGGR